MKKKINLSGFKSGKVSEDRLFSWLSPQAPCLIVDGGAGIGHWVKSAKNKGLTGAFHCFEPFQKNVELFEKLGNLTDDIKLHTVALYNEDGTVKFTIRKTVKDDSKKKGYSSLGRVALDRHQNKNNEIETEVDSVRLDSVFSERINLLKLDLQGGEHEALLGAESLFKNRMISSILMEFSGDIRNLKYLHKHGFVFFDNEITANKSSDIYDGDITVTREVVKTTGVSSVKFFFNDEEPTSFKEYCERFRMVKKKGEYMQNDLICIHKDFLDDFLGDN